ncbi:MAG: TldD/PmbA family protein [Chloroflexi bacterium]|nr:MAG: TldD/PmbA family protein [Chloroflexota bacterium]RLC96893.1 MAG: TldD/PmbA family protein [Chloroflexota bacterium]
MDELLSLATKVAQEAEVFLVSYEETPVVFEANRLKQVQTRSGMSVALRIVRHGRIGLATSTRLDDRVSLVERAVEVSQFGATARFELPSQQTYPQVNVYDPAVEAFPVERMIELGEALISRVREHTPDLLCEASVTRSVTTLRILNSRGGQAGFQRSYFGLALEGNLIRDTDVLFVGDGESSSHLIEDTATVVATVTRQLDLAKRQASVSSGHMPVIFTPQGVVSALIAPLASAFNGRVVLQGASPLGHRRGEKVFDQRLSLKDDATVAQRPRSRPCDDEGVPSRATYLISNGVVGEFLYDLQTAGLAGTQSTGNGERGSGTVLPGPSISSLVFETGEPTFEELVQEMKEGLIVEQLMGASQTNVLGGDFSGNVLLGYKVETGEIVGRVKDTVVSGNVYQALGNLVGIGRHGRWVGAVFTPALCCQKLTVGSKT